MQNQTIVERYHQAMYDKSADALADLYAADAVHEFPFTSPGFPDRFEGREAIREGYRKIWGAVPFRLEGIEDVTMHPATDPEVIVAEQVAVARIGEDGPRVRVPSLVILRIRDGEIVHCRDYMDALAASDVRDAAA
jgi:ketosteroid isomerase-like protein